MIGWDMFVSRVLTKGEIIRALATALGVKQDKILIVKSINGVEYVDKNTLVLCQTFLSKNHDFPLRIDTYIRVEQIIYEKAATIEQLSRLLQCNILIGDETLNPVSFWLYLYENGRGRNDYIRLYV